MIRFNKARYSQTSIRSWLLIGTICSRRSVLLSRLWLTPTTWDLSSTLNVLLGHISRCILSRRHLSIRLAISWLNHRLTKATRHARLQLVLRLSKRLLLLWNLLNWLLLNRLSSTFNHFNIVAFFNFVT